MTIDSGAFVAVSDGGKTVTVLVSVGDSKTVVGEESSAAIEGGGADGVNVSSG